MGDLRRGLAAVSALVVALAGCGGGSAKEDAAPKVNGAPMALAAASAEASFGEMVTLDGGASSDPDGDALTYDWTQTAGPPVSLAAQGALALFQAPSFVGTLRFELTVRDPVGATSVTEARVLVLADKRKAVFVAKEGLDTAAGTRGEPLATVGAAIAKAAGASGGGVYVAAGQYDEGLALESGVSIYGGFQPGTWLRDPTAFVTTIAGGPTAVVVAGKSGIVLDGLEIRSGDAADAGGSSAAVLVANSIDVRLQGCRLKAGLGGSGSAGLAGSAGGGGGGGAPGANARTSCNALVPGGGGGGGTAQFGGGGGAGGCGTAAGQRGGVGYGGTSGGAGSPYLSGVAGSPGASGASGVAGAAGASGAAFGAVDASGYLAASGPPGAPGGFGNGGGGGGGGAGYYSFLTGAYAGAGGGGGGAGGDGGGAGGGGGGGGGSFGVILYASTGVVIADVGIVTGGGGAGGDGALGGLGGAGGAGGPGGFVSSAYVTAGGAGGHGGAGGDGGGGGGGGGGPSIGIVEDAASSATRQNVTVELGAAGAGGAGPGASGAAGMQASYVKR